MQDGPRISQGEAASLIAFSSEAVTDANRTEQIGADIALSSAQSAAAGLPESREAPQQMDVPINVPQDAALQASAPETTSIMQTPAHPQIMQIASHPGLLSEALKNSDNLLLSLLKPNLF